MDKKKQTPVYLVGVKQANGQMEFTAVADATAAQAVNTVVKANVTVKRLTPWEVASWASEGKPIVGMPKQEPKAPPTAGLPAGDVE